MADCNVVSVAGGRRPLTQPRSAEGTGIDESGTGAAPVAPGRGAAYLPIFESTTSSDGVEITREVQGRGGDPEVQVVAVIPARVQPGAGGVLATTTGRLGGAGAGPSAVAPLQPRAGDGGGGNEGAAQGLQGGAGAVRQRSENALGSPPPVKRAAPGPDWLFSPSSSSATIDDDDDRLHALIRGAASGTAVPRGQANTPFTTTAASAAASVAAATATRAAHVASAAPGIQSTRAASVGGGGRVAATATRPASVGGGGRVAANATRPAAIGTVLQRGRTSAATVGRGRCPLATGGSCSAVPDAAVHSVSGAGDAEWQDVPYGSDQERAELPGCLGRPITVACGETWGFVTTLYDMTAPVLGVVINPLTRARPTVRQSIERGSFGWHNSQIQMELVRRIQQNASIVYLNTVYKAVTDNNWGLRRNCQVCSYERPVGGWVAMVVSSGGYNAAGAVITLRYICTTCMLHGGF